jgi:hypothetical protein
MRAAIAAFIVAHPREGGAHAMRSLEIGFADDYACAHWDEPFLSSNNTSKRRSESAIFDLRGGHVLPIARGGETGDVDVPLDRWPHLLAVSDVDGDGHADLVIEELVNTWVHVDEPVARVAQRVLFATRAPVRVFLAGHDKSAQPLLPVQLGGIRALANSSTTVLPPELAAQVNAWRWQDGALATDDAFAARVVAATAPMRARHLAAEQLHSDVDACIEAPMPKMELVPLLTIAAAARAELAMLAAPASVAAALDDVLAHCAPHSP